MKPLVSQGISAETLDTLEHTDERYELIIVPLVVEALSGSLDTFLRKLRLVLSADGRVIIATSNQARLDSRLAAVMGQPVTANAEASAVSLSWPAVPTIHEFHSSELRSAGQSAGFHVRACDAVVSERAFLEMEPLNAFDYARRKLRGVVMRSLPTSRDVLVLELSPRVGEGVAVKTREDDPFVSVFVAAHRGGDALRETVGALMSQTYPKSLYEIVVLHDGSRPDVAGIVAEAADKGACGFRELVLPHADGPEARNQAMAESRSDISAHTNDQCYLPEDWMQAAVGWFDADTVAVTGPVFLKAGSDGRFLSVPSTRPDPDEKGVSPQSIFPISNVFYRTPIVVAAG
ncbi:MAG: glycosyltransferase, partial [Dehalococcoidia bacterium]